MASNYTYIQLTEVNGFQLYLNTINCWRHENYIQRGVTLRASERCNSVQLKFNDEIFFIWIAFNIRGVFFSCHRRFNMDFPAIVCDRSVIWEYSGGCLLNFSFQLVDKMIDWWLIDFWCFNATFSNISG
jgi:hypothetical protein